MEKIVVVVMGQNCERFLPMCLESVKDADAIVYCDGGSIDSSLEKAKGFLGFKDFVDVIKNEYNQEDPTMNGKQRNFYLNYLKENFPNDWALCLDADEVLEDDGMRKIRGFIEKMKGGCYSPKMRHFIGDLGHEDATQETHFVLNRLFKISDVKEYPEVEHPVLNPKDDVLLGGTECVTIWHLSYIPNMWEMKKKYENHLKKSNMHSPLYLKNWHRAHLFGVYPKSQVNPIEIPKTILDNFNIDKDELYFENRGLEVKHFIMAKQWLDHFKPKSVIDFGAGRGPFGVGFVTCGVRYHGVELSKYAVENKLSSNLNLVQGDILNYDKEEKHNLVMAFDVLEHIKYEELDKAINTLCDVSDKYILVSVPFLGDPNLEADPTHIIKEDKKWWAKRFTDRGLLHLPTPSHWLHKDQIMIFKK